MTLRLEPGARLVAATHNPGKARELAALLEDRCEVISAASLGLPEPDEPETTFVGNAIVKARAAADASGLPAIADDSGLCVAALDGAPGVHSARWSGPTRDFAHAMALVETRLAETGLGDPAAWFVCALAVAWPNGPIVAVEGRIDGALVFPGRGLLGFGYDPDLRSRRRRADLRRDGPGRQARHQPPGAGVRGAEGGGVLRGRGAHSRPERRRPRRYISAPQRLRTGPARTPALRLKMRAPFVGFADVSPASGGKQA